MKTAITKDRAISLPKLATVVLTFAICAPASAQQGGYSSQEFYRQGDAFSERVSGFFSRLFKPGSQPSQYQAAQPQYKQPGAYRAPASAAPAAARTPYTYPQAPATAAVGAGARPTTAGAWSNYAQPQTPNYRMPPPGRNSTTASSMSAKKPSYSNGSTERQRVSSQPRAPETTPEKITTTESVVKAPTEGSSPYNPTPNEPDPLPLPKQSFSGSSTTGMTDSTASKAGSNQSFPVATPSKTPGRVISPYPPNKELDVRGLPSGSLALDPTTQKVFKVP